MATQDLTTLSAVREHLQISDGTDTDSDALLTSLITAASDLITHYTGRRFQPTQDAAEKVFAYSGRGVVSFEPWVLRSLDSVQIDTDTSSPTTLSSDTYALRPLGSLDGIYTRLHISGYGVTESLTDDAPAEREITITGDWGYSSVPTPVARACILTVASMFSSTAIRGSFYEQESPGITTSAIPGMAKSLLAPYRVRVSGS